ncbi:hypothetical protein [Enterobacter hormaechei]|uniref:hypothetical protein n=1 Tax=Enterobacter hormaechei TaxID=158836 RepID=UPI0029D72B96|nr:hypothetical protein [Enterobacter hormaechei]MDX7122039.1 hypothetical protein [Enterobacter hormaechei]
MFIPVWALVLIALIVGFVIYTLNAKRKYHHAMAVRNYRQWGLMRHEFECLSNGVMVLIGRLEEHPELVKSIENELGEYTILSDIDTWCKAYNESDHITTYRIVREIIYRHWSVYDYADVEQDINYYGKYRSE